MEVITSEENSISSSKNEKCIHRVQNDFIEISSNWNVVGGKELRNTVTTVLQKDFLGSMALDDIADANTSLEIQSGCENESCTVEIKLKNGQKIVRMGISSEASILEIFKQFGEYATTVFSEFIDEFEGCTVYLGGVVFDKPTPETSIKFTRVNNERTSMYLYGIRLVLEDSSPSEEKSTEQLDFNIISNFLKLANIPKRKESTQNSSNNVPKSLSLVLRDSGMVEYFQRFGEIPEDCEKSSNDNGTWSVNHSKNNNDSPKENSNCALKSVAGNLTNPDLLIFEESINEKLRGMEKRLMERIDQAEKNTNRVLDEILKKLDLLKN